MKKILSISIILLTIIIFLAVGFAPVFAQTTTSATPLGYVPLSGDIPGITGDLTFASFVEAVFKLALGSATVLAVLIIVIGGFTYMTSDSVSGKKSGIDMLNNAVFGLLIALGAWLILYTINPALLEFNLKLPKVDVPATAPSPTDPVEGSEESAARVNLLSAGIGVNKLPCPEGKSYKEVPGGCTNVAGIPSNMISYLENLLNDIEKKYPHNTVRCGIKTGGNNTTNCTVVISGGSEPGHATHGPGYPVIDLKKNHILDDYILTNKSCQENTSIGTLYKVGNVSYVNEGNHWHVCVGSACRISGLKGNCN